MSRSRREFVTEAAMFAAASGALMGTRAMAVDADSADGQFFKVYPIGRVEKDGETTRIRIFEQYADGLVGLDQWSHVNVFYWFDKNDTPEKRRVLQVHPRGDQANPLTGVFACRSPVRPNLIALSVCQVIAVEKNLIVVDQLDAFDATPVIDLKPFIPPDAPRQNLRVPQWTGRRPPQTTP